MSRQHLGTVPLPGRPSDRPARVLIVDDHEMARAGLRCMLAGRTDLTVVGEGRSGREAIALCAELRPDLVLMDLRMPDMSGLDATAAIRRADPRVRVIVVTMHDGPDYHTAALRAGASGFVLKSATQREIVSAVTRVLSGGSAVDDRPAARPPYCRVAAGEETPVLVERITPREHDVLRLLAEGQTNRQIALALGLSAGTVKIHVERLIAKLGARDRTQAAVRALSLGILARPASPTARPPAFAFPAGARAAAGLSGGAQGRAA
jgi:DNA-binding NarL/FixJ family response regulator